jgi:CO/xanthine dehydrogenase Mo-binding subunit
VQSFVAELAAAAKRDPKDFLLEVIGPPRQVSAAVVHVAVDDKGVMTIPRVDMAVDCGATVNPDRVRAQMEGACVMGVGVATLGEISFKNGRVVKGSGVCRSANS